MTRLLWWMLTCACLAGAADVVLVRQTVSRPTRTLDQETVDGFLGRLSRRLREAGIQAATMADTEVTPETLREVRLALLPYNPAVPEGAASALAAFVGRGGKLGLFYCSDERLTGLVGVRGGQYRGGDALPKLEGVAFDPAVVPSSPPRMRQRSWNVVVPAPAEGGGAQAAGFWAPADGGQASVPAFTVHPAGFTFGHVYLDEDPEAGEQWLLATVEHFVPGTWAGAVRRRLAALPGVPGCDTMEALETRARAANRPEAVQACQEARGLARQADAAAASGRFLEAQELARQAARSAERTWLLTVPSRRGELRGAWIHSAYGIAGWGWDRTIKALAENGFNAVFANLCWGAVADYASEVLPVHPDVASRGDQLQQCLDACRRHGVELHVWRVNWNMGHRTPPAVRDAYVRAGRVQVTRKGETSLFLAPHLEENFRQERDAMLEIVRRWPVAGIHFDYIRYPGEECDFSDSARDAFTRWRGAPVSDWPADCAPGGTLREDYNRWRRENIDRLVREVSREARALRPDIRISAAVFGGWQSARESIAQDAVRWVEEGWLDFVCPMNYTTSETFLSNLLREQTAAVRGRIPLYCGIGAWQHPTAAQTAAQIDLARRLGADGFICFSLTERFATSVLPLLALGATRDGAGPLLPHHPSARLRFQTSGGREDLEGDYPLRRRITVRGTLAARPYRFTPTVTLLRDGYPVAAGPALATDTSSAGVRCDLRPREPGMYQIEVGGTVQWRRDEEPAPILSRSPPVRVLSEEEAAAARRRTGPPQFARGKGIKVAVWQEDTYGGGPILEALAGRPGVVAAPLFNLKPDSLDACDVVILPQPRALTRRLRDEATWKPVREFVRRGGGVMVTHSLVGIRGFPVLFPEVAAGAQPLETSEWRLSGRLAIGEGVPEGPNRSTFTDCISLQPGAAGMVIMEAPGGTPIAALGRFGRGRVLACGLGLGIGPGDKDADLPPAESAFLANAVHWLAGRRRP